MTQATSSSNKHCDDCHLAHPFRAAAYVGERLCPFRSFTMTQGSVSSTVQGGGKRRATFIRQLSLLTQVQHASRPTTHPLRHPDPNAPTPSEDRHRRRYDGEINGSIERALVNRAFRMRTVKQASVLFRIQGGVTRRDSA